MYHVLQNQQNDYELQLYHQGMTPEEVASQMYPKNIRLPSINVSFSFVNVQYIQQFPSLNYSLLN